MPGSWYSWLSVATPLSGDSHILLGFGPVLLKKHLELLKLSHLPQDLVLREQITLQVSIFRIHSPQSTPLRSTFHTCSTYFQKVSKIQIHFQKNAMQIQIHPQKVSRYRNSQKIYLVTDMYFKKYLGIGTFQILPENI